jgi:hypothetical protein
MTADSHQAVTGVKAVPSTVRSRPVTFREDSAAAARGEETISPILR